MSGILEVRIAQYSEDGPRPIKTEFGYQGRRLRQLKREGDVAIYEVLGGGGKMLLGYEVVRIRVAPPNTFPDGSSVPWREIYPSSSRDSTDWGLIAFSYPRNGLDRAMERFGDMLSCGEGTPQGSTNDEQVV